MNSSISLKYKRARTTALVLLFFLGLSALPAALLMLIDPSGMEMGLPLELLDHTPFNSFLIPAIILGLFNGILSLFFAVFVLRNHPLQAWMIMLQGGILLVWLTAELIMKIYYPFLTIPYYLVAILLVVCGLLMKLSKSGLS